MCTLPSHSDGTTIRRLKEDHYEQRTYESTQGLRGFLSSGFFTLVHA